MDYYYFDQLRWNFGFENPNHAAALIAALLPLAWAVKGWFEPRKKFAQFFWWSGASALLLVGWWMLGLTLSRGGLVAALAGFIFIAWRTFPEWKSTPIKCIGLTAAITGVLWISGLVSRSSEGILSSDASVENRIEVWKGGLQMLAISPFGVGSGKSGEFYMHWLQAVDATTGYRTLVNSYLTYLAEYGLVVGFIALTLVGVLILLTLPCVKDSRLQNWVIACHASLIAFAIAGIFSTTFETPWVWIAPALALGILAGLTIRFGRSPSFHILRAGFTAVALGVMGILLVWIVGVSLENQNSIRVTHMGLGQMLIQPRDAGDSTWVALSDVAVAGSDYGKRLRQLASERRIKIIAVSEGGRFPQCDGVVAMGDRVSEILDFKGRVLLIAPAVTDEKQAQSVLNGAVALRLINPGFDEDGRVAFWTQQLSRSDHKIETRAFEGFGNDLSQQWAGIVQFMDAPFTN